MRNHERRGSAMVVALIVIVILMGMGIALATFSHPFIRRTAEMNLPIKASYGAEAALEKCWYEISTSNYNVNGNMWLIANSGAAPNGVLVMSNVPVGTDPMDPRVTVRGYDIGGLFYRFEATATWMDSSGKTRKTTVAQEYRARDSFARYMWFVDDDSMNVGNATVKGYVHDNQGINFYWGGASFYKEVVAVNGFGYFNGATTGNTSFYDGSDPSGNNVPMPNVNQIAQLHVNAATGYKFMGQNDNVDVTFINDQVHLVATSQTGVLLSDQTLPLPSNGLIFIQGNFTVTGQMSGRATIASMGSGTIKNDLIYTDNSGNPQYQLSLNGTAITNNDAVTAPWTDPGYAYGPNPNFTGDPNNPPALGIMVQNDIFLRGQAGNTAEFNKEVHAAIYTAQGSWQSDLIDAKGTLLVNGSLVSDNRGWRYSSNGSQYWGWGAAGMYNYDNNLLNKPPPFYLQVDLPVKGSRWIMNKGEITNPADKQ